MIPEASVRAADDMVNVTPSDTVDLPGGVCRGLYVGVSGNVNLITPSGVTIVIVGLAAGIVHPIRASRIKSTNTNASSIVAVY